MRRKATRARGAGRKPLDPSGTAIVPIRMSATLQRAVDRVAKKYRVSRTAIIRGALERYVGRFQLGRGDIERLGDAIVLLAHSIESRSGKKWFEDYTTGMALRKQTAQFIDHFARSPAKQVSAEVEVVPPELDVVGYLIAVIENPPIRLSGSGPESAILSALAQPPPYGLGSGVQRRNKAVWQKGAKS